MHLIELLRFLIGLGLLWLLHLIYPRLLIGLDTLIPFINCNGISGHIFCLALSFLSDRQLRMVLDENSLQEYPVDAGVLQDSILGPTLFLLYINDLPDDVICTNVI